MPSASDGKWPTAKQVRPSGAAGKAKEGACCRFTGINGALVRRPTMPQDDVVVYRRAADASDVADELRLQRRECLGQPVVDVRAGVSEEPVANRRGNM